MITHEKLLTQRQRYQPVILPQDFSDEEMVGDWTLSDTDRQEVGRYRTHSRLFIAVRLYGRFLAEVNDLSPRIVSYLNSRLHLPPSLMINTPDREAAFSEQRKNILSYLGFSKYDDEAQSQLHSWLEKQAQQGFLPDELFLLAERYLLAAKVILPGPSVMERLIVRVCADVHERLFESLNERLSPAIKRAIDNRRSLKGKDGKIQRNAWELGLAIAMKEALRSGDLFLSKSKQHVSVWDSMLDQPRWQDTREAAYADLQQPYQRGGEIHVDFAVPPIGP